MPRSRPVCWGLRWRLFDFGRINAQIAQAKGQEAEQLAAYRLAVLRATEDVENAFTALVKREQQAAVLSQEWRRSARRVAPRPWPMRKARSA